MFILKKGHQPGVYVPLRALFLVTNTCMCITLHFCLKYDSNFLAMMELGLLSTMYINPGIFLPFRTWGRGPLILGKNSARIYQNGKI